MLFLREAISLSRVVIRIIVTETRAEASDVLLATFL